MIQVMILNNFQHFLLRHNVSYGNFYAQKGGLVFLLFVDELVNTYEIYCRHEIFSHIILALVTILIILLTIMNYFSKHSGNQTKLLNNL